MSFLYFIILVGVLIFVHELGHFLAAKLFDVKVLRFSIGFGPRVLGVQRGETEYVLCALPLGGYVRMLGAETDDVEALEDDEDRERSLMSKPIWQRSLIILAGPAFNLIFPVFIYLLVAMGQTEAPPSIVGEVFEDTPAAAAGLEPGDRVVAIDGEPIRYWHEITDRVTDSWDQLLELTYERDGSRRTVAVTPEKKSSTDFLELNVRTYGMLGIHLGTYGTTVGLRQPNGPAAQAGLRPFDKILTVDGQPVRRFDELQSRVRASHGGPLQIVGLRRVAVPVEYGQLYRQEPFTLRAQPIKGEDGRWTSGLVRAEMVLSEVEPNSPAAAAGLQVGDEIVSLEGRSFNNWGMLNRKIYNSINEMIVAQHEAGAEKIDVAPLFQVGYVRGGQRLQTRLRPEVIEYEDTSKQEQYRFEIGWRHFPDTVYPEDIDFPFFSRLGHGVEQSVEETADFVKVMVMGFVRMAQGRISLGNVGGPILIGELAAKAGEAGLEPFLKMMALISINLGVFNLLPIPLLDGGQLLLFVLEAIKRGPLSFRTRQIAAYIGIVMVILLFTLAFKNDIERKWDDIVEWVEG